jgi:3-oxoacyl-[acyl-carrier-protein] synthase-3
MRSAGVGPQAIDLLIHCSVCRDRLEPATAAYIHGLLGLGAQTQILDISNACLGFANALVLAAGLVESGQIRCALICAGEDGRPLVEHTLRTLNDDLTLTRESIKPYFANLTIGAGAAAALVMRDDIAPAGGFRLLAAAAATDSAANRLCEGDTAASELDMRTDSEALLHAGVALAATCWQSFAEVSGWTAQTPDRVVTHQVGRRHAALLYERLGLAIEKDCPSLETLGNVGSVSLPATLGLARADGRIAPGHRVALLGIGSGLSSLMLAAEAL